MRRVLALSMTLCVMLSATVAYAGTPGDEKWIPAMQWEGGGGSSVGAGQNNIGGGNSDPWGANMAGTMTGVGKALEKAGSIVGGFGAAVGCAGCMKVGAVIGGIGAALDAIGGSSGGTRESASDKAHNDK